MALILGLTGAAAASVDCHLRETWNRHVTGRTADVCEAERANRLAARWQETDMLDDGIEDVMCCSGAMRGRLVVPSIDIKTLCLRQNLTGARPPLPRKAAKRPNLRR